MKLIAILFLVCGVGLAGGAIYAVSEHFSKLEASLAQDEGPQSVQVLVAKMPLHYGNEISMETAEDAVRWIDWPADSAPEGAFFNAKEFLGEDLKEVRTVLRSIEPGELVLKTKVTGFGEGVRLQVSDGMRAVTIPINAVTGGGGHIAPGDRVDIEFTRKTQGQMSSHILLWNVPVIALDQSSDTERGGATLAQTATVEVTPTDARKLRLALNAGTLALLLRGAEEIATTPEKVPEEEVIDLNVLPGAVQQEPEPEPEPEQVEQPTYQPRLPTGKSIPDAKG